MSLLSICHSVGDSNIIKETAKKLAEDSIKTTILVVGDAARKNIKAFIKSLEENKQNPIRDFIHMIDLDELLAAVKPIDSKQLKLSESEIHELTKQINIKQFNALLVGTPSYVEVNEQCEIPEQLLAKLANDLHSAVVSDYAFYDPKHHLSTRKWFNMARKFFVPFEKALLAFAPIVPSMVVGHPSVDATKSLYQGWLSQNQEDANSVSKRAEIQKKLEIQNDQKLIFVAGGKAGDEAMVKALANTCQQFPEIQVVLGMHPFASSEYLSSIQRIIEENKANGQIKFMSKSVNTDEAVYAADGVMTVTSTVGTTAAACSKYVAFYQENAPKDSPTIPYIIEECAKALFCTEPKQLLSFFQTIKEKSKPMSKDDVALSEAAADKIAREMRMVLKNL